jgi:hypothetical protein
LQPDFRQDAIMKLQITGIGAWSRGFRSWDEFQTVCRTLTAETADWTAPAPVHIPGRERRRAPAMTKLAVEVAHQACNMAGIEKGSVASVFSSAMGDSEIARYMCETLAGPEKVLSPTRFHNSVHNAPAGYWSISAENRAPSNSIAGSRHSFPVALLEAAVFSAAESRPVLLVSADIQVRGPHEAVFPIENPFGAALLIDNACDDARGWPFTLALHEGSADWPGLENPFLQTLSDTNPSARCLRLIEAIASCEQARIQWPVSESTFLELVLPAPDQTRS